VAEGRGDRKPAVIRPGSFSQKEGKIRNPWGRKLLRIKGKGEKLEGLKTTCLGGSNGLINHLRSRGIRKGPASSEGRFGSPSSNRQEGGRGRLINFEEKGGKTGFSGKRGGTHRKLERGVLGFLGISGLGGKVDGNSTQKARGMPRRTLENFL